MILLNILDWAEYGWLLVGQLLQNSFNEIQLQDRMVIFSKVLDFRMNFFNNS